MAKKEISDHIIMISAANGSEKAVPCWQIKSWIAQGSFSLELESGNPIGYDFKDHNQAIQEYKTWGQEQARIRLMRQKRAAGPQKVDEGIAGAQFQVNVPPSVPDAFSDMPEAPESGTESIGAEPEIEPEDTI